MRAVAKHRLRARAQDGGAVIFIVAMTLAVLASLGIYALHAAATEIRTSGNARQATQTHYLAEYGATGAVQALTGDRAALELARLRDHPDGCTSLDGVPPDAGQTARGCRRLGAADLGGGWVNAPLTAYGGADTPGSFGPIPLDGDFMVELTDPGPVTPPPGFALDGPVRFRRVTVTSTGTTRPHATEGSEGVAAGEGVETVRAQVATGPIPPSVAAVYVGSDDVVRRRYTCGARDGKPAVALRPVAPEANDDFGVNVATGSPARHFLTAQAVPVGSGVTPKDKPSPLGPVLHPMPDVVGPPSAQLHDVGYIRFADLHRGRRNVLYAATADGLLHAFWADPPPTGGPTNNELWTFVPPAAFPELAPSSPAPVIRDVVWERKRGQLADPTRWHTALVAGFGGRGYYALDVTDPEPDHDDHPASPAGPHFLWQLTTSGGARDSQTQLFGARSATPAITTVFIDPDGTGQPREVGVAILPGGSDDPPTKAGPNEPTCERAQKPKPAGTSDHFAPRSRVRRWGRDCAAGVSGRSVTVVRLDTGEVVAAFGRVDLDPKRSDLPRSLVEASPSRAVNTPLDSPMIGVPAVYPNDVGAIATKFFVGDADGTTWRFDIGDPDPRKWRGELFFDAYNADADPRGEEARALGGRPIRIAPVLALDPAGNLVLTFATGDPEDPDTAAATTTFVYSLREVPTPVAGTTELRPRVNWFLPFAPQAGRPGERVTGPLVLFDGVLYFATFAPPVDGVPGAAGEAHLWGRDYRTPDPVCSAGVGCGGVKRLARPCRGGPCAPAPMPAYVVPSDEDASLGRGALSDLAVYPHPVCIGSNGSPPRLASDGYVVSTRVRTKPGRASPIDPTYEQPIPPPSEGARIEGWASVVE